MTESGYPSPRSTSDGNGIPGSVTACSVLDIEGVAEIGVDAWRAHYAWPVSDEDYESLCTGIWKAWLDAAGKLDGVSADLLLADIGLPGFLLQHLHVACAHHRLLQAGSSPGHGSVIAPYLRPDWNALSQDASLGSRSKSSFQDSLRNAAKGWLLNGHATLPERIGTAAGQGETWALGSRTPLRAAYLEQSRMACRFVSHGLFLASDGGGREARLQDVTAQLTDRFRSVSRETLGVDFDVDAARKTWMARLGVLARLAQGATGLSTLPKRLLLTDLGQPANRIIARTLSRSGVTVVGFHHGNEMGAQPFPTSDIVDLLPVDRFAVPSEGCLAWRKKHYEQGWISSLHEVEFERVPTGLYRGWLAESDTVALPEHVETVMIVGFPPNWIRYPHLIAHWGLTQFEVECSLAECLAEAGYRVLYKAHPEWESQLRRVMAGLPCEFVGGRLEDCWPDADAFVFARTSSTSFGFALCTNRPIVLLDHGAQTWEQEGYAMLARRCRMVPAKVQEGLKIEFDKETLLGELRNPVKEPDQSFVLEAMCR